MKKFLSVSILAAAVICLSFYLGFLYSAFQPNQTPYVDIVYNQSGQLVRQTTYINDDTKFFSPGKKHGIESHFDDQGELISTGEWRNGKPWHGKCFVLEAGDAGSWAGLGSYRVYENGVELKNTP